MQPANGDGAVGGGGVEDVNRQTQHPQQQQQASPQYQQQWPAYQSYYPQQWMAMGMQPYPAAAMAMQQQMMMMYPHHYMPYVNYARHYQQQPYQQQQREMGQQKQSAVRSGSVKEDEIKTVWIGDLHPWMDESYLQSCFVSAGELVSVKVIRDRQTGQSDGYGFVEFSSRAEAETALQYYPSTTMPHTEQPFNLNWATFSPVERRPDPDSDLSVFVGDLASDVTDTTLQEIFASKYQSIKSVKVIVDPNTGRSKGYGFIRFGDESEKLRAVTEMDGTLCLSRPMRVAAATPKRSAGYQHHSSQASAASRENSYYGSPAHGDYQLDNDTNTTIFVGGVDAETTEEDIRQPFSQFGEITSLKIPAGKGCAFVQFAERSNAEDAIQGLNGTIIGKRTFRLAWGRTPEKKQWRNNNQHWSGGANWRQSYRGHGYSSPQYQDPSMYTDVATTSNGEL